jgi:hypothetical protein
MTDDERQLKARADARIEAANAARDRRELRRRVFGKYDRLELARCEREIEGSIRAWRRKRSANRQALAAQPSAGFHDEAKARDAQDDRQPRRGVRQHCDDSQRHQQGQGVADREVPALARREVETARAVRHGSRLAADPRVGTLRGGLATRLGRAKTNRQVFPVQAPLSFLSHSDSNYIDWRLTCPQK